MHGDDGRGVPQHRPGPGHPHHQPGPGYPAYRPGAHFPAYQPGPPPPPPPPRGRPKWPWFVGGGAGLVVIALVLGLFVWPGLPTDSEASHDATGTSGDSDDRPATWALPAMSRDEASKYDEFNAYSATTRTWNLGDEVLRVGIGGTDSFSAIDPATGTTNWKVNVDELHHPDAKICSYSTHAKPWVAITVGADRDHRCTKLIVVDTKRHKLQSQNKLTSDPSEESNDVAADALADGRMALAMPLGQGEPKYPALLKLFDPTTGDIDEGTKLDPLCNGIINIVADGNRINALMGCFDDNADPMSYDKLVSFDVNAGQKVWESQPIEPTPEPVLHVEGGVVMVDTVTTDMTGCQCYHHDARLYDEKSGQRLSRINAKNLDLQPESLTSYQERYERLAIRDGLLIGGEFPDDGKHDTGNQLAAYDVRTGQRKWTSRLPDNFYPGTLTTAEDGPTPLALFDQQQPAVAWIDPGTGRVEHVQKLSGPTDAHQNETVDVRVVDGYLTAFPGRYGRPPGYGFRLDE